jgi:transposase
MATGQEVEDGSENQRPRWVPSRRNLSHLPAHLNRYKVVIEPEDRGCPCCGRAMHQIELEERGDWLIHISFTEVAGKTYFF